MKLITTQEKTECFKLAYQRSSRTEQLDKLMEEMSELMQAIMKARYNESLCIMHTPYSKNVLEEMGHVELAMEMIRFDMAIVHQPSVGRLIDTYRSMKDARLATWYTIETGGCGE